MDIRSFDTATHHELGLMQGFPPPPERRVTAENGLWTPPFNRWAYQHMRQLLPTAGWRNVNRPIDLHRSPDERIDRVMVERTDGSTADFDTFLRETFTDSFVVVSDGQIVCERYLNGMTPDQPHQMMSCTKCFVGLFALLAAERGVMSEDDVVGDLVPEVGVDAVGPSGAFSEATVGQALDMTSSMQFHEDYADPDAHIHDYAALVGLGPGTDRDIDAGTIYDYLPTLVKDDALDHGEVCHYQTPSTDMVSWLTCRTTGTALLDDFEALWRGIGADGDAYLLLDPAGTPVAGGGLNATPNDLARFGYMVANDGRIDERDVVPPSVLDKLSAGGSIDAFLAGPEAKGAMDSGEWSYRAQWWIRHTPGREALAAIGTNGQWIYCDRARRIAVVKQSSQPVSAAPEFDDYILNAFDAVVDALTEGARQ